MRNFYRLAHGVDVTGLVAALHAKPHLWNRNALRREYPGTPHRECDDIWLRFQPEGMSAEQVVDAHESVNYPALAELPMVRPMIFALMRQVEGERLGRVLITRLAPGKRIYPHVDGGDHAAYFKRYQIALHSEPGVLFRAGDEQVSMRTGEVWWFDNGQEHEVVNNSADDRLALIVDIRPCG
jgi:quercetin dioxygenase-like cupin family protein